MWTNLQHKLPTIALAGVVAMMIWLYAEGENLREETIVIDVQFVDPGSGSLAIQTELRRVTVTAQAPNATFSALRRIREVRLDVEEKPNLDSYPMQTIALREQLAASPAFLSLGASVIKTEPESVAVSVQRLEEVTLPVRVVYGEVDLKSAPIIEPEQVTIRVPASRVISVRDLDLRVVIDNQAVASMTPNTPQTLETSLVMPDDLVAALGDFAIQVALPKARVSLTLRSQEEMYDHPSIPIRVAAAWTLLNEYEVDLIDRVALEGVVLRGPRQAIEQIRSGERKVWADIELTSKDFETPLTSATVSLAGPPGVFSEKPLPNVEIRITRRQVDPMQ